MDLKNAAAVCLISLFSATLVLLIARALDLQSAARLEPQLERIAEQLEALNQRGGIQPTEGEATGKSPLDDGLMVYYFHSNTRCPTCESIESQAKKTVESRFAAQLADGQMAWKILNYEQPSGKALGKTFNVEMAVVVLARMKGGQIERWKRLDQVWGLYDDEPAFAAFLTGEIEKMLPSAEKSKAATPQSDAPAIPVPGGSAADEPAPAASIPVP